MISDNKIAPLWTKTFIMIAMVNMLTFFGFNMTIVGMPLYVASLGANDTLVGLMAAFNAVTALFIRPFSGIILDLINRRGVLLTGLGVMVLSTLASAVFPLVSVLLGLRLLHGVGWGLSSTATSTMAADAIPKSRFAEGMGYIGLATALTTAVAPALAVTLLHVYGAVPMICVSAGSYAAGLVLAFFLKPKETTRGDESPDQGNNAGIKVSDLFDKRAFLPSGVMLLVAIASVSISTFIALFGQTRGVGNISLYFVVYAATMIISRPPVGKLIDRVGFFVPGLLSMAGVSVGIVIISFSVNITMFCIAGVFAGLGMGTVMSTMQAMAVASVPPKRRGVATSTYLFGFDSGITLGAIIAGLIAGYFGYSIMYIIMAGFPIIGCIVFLISGRKRISSYQDFPLRDV